jgi:hypothetical protein
MTAIELKTFLMHRISEINDVSFLKAIKTILDSKTNKEILKLTDEQTNEIMKSKLEIEQGLHTAQENIDLEVSNWAKVK